MMVKILNKYTILSIVFLFLNACASSPPKAPVSQVRGDYGYLKEYMSWFIQKEMNDKNIVGLSVALVDDQEIVWQQGFGFADKANEIKATPETRYRAGSVSKLFNGMAVMKLVESGKMDLDMPLATYLPDFKIKSRYGSTDGITPRTILTHHSGLPGDWIDGYWSSPSRSFTELVQLIQEEYVAYPPNKILSYSNLGVTLLGHAVQEVGGVSYNEFMDQALFQPMGMRNSRFDPILSGDKVSKAYIMDKEIPDDAIGLVPAGALNTTVLDLARLAMIVNNKGCMENRQILSQKSLDSMFQVQNENIALDLDGKIGLAWFIDDRTLVETERIYFHNGATAAHRAMFLVAPESRIGVAVLANSGTANTNLIAEKLAQMAWEAKHGQELNKDNENKNSTVAEEPSPDLEGTFATVFGKTKVTKEKEGRYKVNASMVKLKLELEEDNRYYLRYRLLGFIPINLGILGETPISIREIDGYETVVANLQGYPFIAGIRITPSPIDEAWRSRFGKYELLNMPSSVLFDVTGLQLKEEDGFMVLVFSTSRGEQVQIITGVNSNEAIIEGLGRGKRETYRVIYDDHGEELITWAGLKFKKIK